MKHEPQDLKMFERLAQDKDAKDFFLRLTDWLCDVRNDMPEELNRKAMAKFLEEEVVRFIRPKDELPEKKKSDYI